MSRKKIINLLTIVSIFAAAISLFFLFRSMKKPPQVSLPQKAVRMVHTQEVSYDELPGKLEASGRISAHDEIIISSEVTGRLISGTRLFKAGTAFNRGDIIAIVENDEFKFQLQAQRSQFIQNLASTLADIKIDFPDAYNKWLSFFEKIKSDQNLPALPEINNSKERVYLASRHILNDYYSIKGNETRMDKHFIRAPFNGTLKEVSMQVGSVVSMGTRLGIFTRTDLFELEVPVAIENIRILKPGLKVSIKNKEGEHFWTGTINRIADVLNASTQSVSVYITIPSNKKHPLYDGMYLSAEIEGQAIEGVMGIPRDAIFNGHFVHTLKERKLEKHSIDKVFYNNETVYIKGLPSGTQVVTEPILGITDYLEFESIP